MKSTEPSPCKMGMLMINRHAIRAYKLNCACIVFRRQVMDMFSNCVVILYIIKFYTKYIIYRFLCGGMCDGGELPSEESGTEKRVVCRILE